MYKKGIILFDIAKNLFVELWVLVCVLVLSLCLIAESDMIRHKQDTDNYICELN